MYLFPRNRIWRLLQCYIRVEHIFARRFFLSSNNPGHAMWMLLKFLLCQRTFRYTERRLLRYDYLWFLIWRILQCIYCPNDQLSIVFVALYHQSARRRIAMCINELQYVEHPLKRTQASCIFAFCHVFVLINFIPIMQGCYIGTDAVVRIPSAGDPNKHTNPLGTLMSRKQIKQHVYALCDFPHYISIAAIVY